MATPAGVRLASLHAQERQADRVRGQVDVPAVLAPVNDQAMAAQAAGVAPDSAVDRMALVTAPMRLQMARHVTPRQ
jgi:hypothetical protein